MSKLKEMPREATKELGSGEKVPDGDKRPVPSRKKLLVALLVILGLCIILVGCGGEASQQETEPNPEEGLPSTVEWSADSDCSICHTKQGGTMTNPATLAGAHVETGGATCVTCHDDISALEALHADAEVKELTLRRLKNTEVSGKLCESCHGSAEELAALTEGVYLEDANGTKVNPHAVPENEGHVDNENCANCHGGHSDTPVLEEANNYCLSCHHANVYECYTCHH